MTTRAKHLEVGRIVGDDVIHMGSLGLPRLAGWLSRAAATSLSADQVFEETPRLATLAWTSQQAVSFVGRQ
jgi:hypothetical protein